MPIRLRVALFGAGLVMLAMLAFGLLVYALSSAGAADQRDRELSKSAEEAAAAVGGVADSASLLARQPLVPVDALHSAETFVLVVGADGRTVASGGVIDGAPPSIPIDVLRTGTPATIDQPGRPEALRVAVRPIQAGYVVAARAGSSVQAQQAGLRGFLILSGLVILVASLLASWLAAGQALRPLDSVARLMEEIGLTRDLGRRLPTARAHDEVGRLSDAFNGMLQRLQATQQQLAGALDAQRRLVADSSHELRTPLTTIRTNVGLLLQRSDLAEVDRRAALADIASESERMGRLVGDLLTLARADAGQQLHRDPVDLAALVDEVARQACRAYPAREISTSTERSPLRGDAEALTQLVWILLDNAAKYTREGGHIDVRLGRRDNLAELVVADDGAGIAPEDVERIFDRFYRGDAARAGDGAGLGLSIARWIVEQHRGQVSARNGAAGGAVFTVSLPRDA